MSYNRVIALDGNYRIELGYKNSVFLRYELFIPVSKVVSKPFLSPKKIYTCSFLVKWKYNFFQTNWFHFFRSLRIYHLSELSCSIFAFSYIIYEFFVVWFFFFILLIFFCLLPSSYLTSFNFLCTVLSLGFIHYIIRSPLMCVGWF